MRSPVSMQPCLWTSPALVTCSTPPPQGKNTRVANLLHARPQQRGRKCDLTCRRYMRCCKFAQVWNFTPFIYIFRIDNLRAISWFYRWWCLINSVWVCLVNSAILLGGRSNLWEIRPQHLLHFSFLTPSPLKKIAKCSSEGGGGKSMRDTSPALVTVFCPPVPHPPLKKGPNVLQRGEGVKNLRNTSTALVTFFFPPISPPPQFSKILLKWGGGKAKKYCTVTFWRPPPKSGN